MTMDCMIGGNPQNIPFYMLRPSTSSSLFFLLFLMVMEFKLDVDESNYSSIETRFFSKTTGIE